MKLPRPVLFFSALAAVFLVVAVLGALLLPRVIDSQVIKDKISSQWSQKTQGSLSFDKIELQWFPRPHVLMGNVKLSFEEKTEASIRAVRIYPSILNLLAGRLVVRRAQLDEPEITILLPEGSKKPIDLEELANQIRSVVVRLTSDLPVPRIDLNEGSADIRIGERSAVLLKNVAAHASGSPAEFGFEFSGRSNLCEGFTAKGKISPQDFESEIHVGFQRLKIKETLGLLALQVGEYVQQGETSFDAKIQSVGLRQFKASIDGSVGSFAFTRNGGSATVEVKRLKSEIAYQGDVFQAHVEHLDLASPKLKASGNLRMDSDSLSLRVNVRDLDIAEVNEMALRIGEDRAVAKAMFNYLRSGTITEMTFQSAGRSIAEMISSQKIALSAVMRNGKIFIPGPDLELINVSGSVQIADNLLEAKDITTKLGTAKGWDGKLRLGLGGKKAPIHLDILMSTPAPDLQSLLLKIIKDNELQGELLKVRNLQGDLSGRVILGGTLDAISPVVTVSRMNVNANYEPVLFPITIRSGSFRYDSKTSILEDARGSMGRSSFDGLGVTFHHDGSRRIQIDSKRMMLDLQQTQAVLRRFKNFPGYFSKIEVARGHIEMEKVALTGAYDDPAGWSLTSLGSFHQVEVRHADFPEPITVSRGNFAASQGRFRFSDTAAAMSDAALNGGGAFEYKKGAPFRFETSATGTLGAQTTQWLSRYVELPQQVKLRSPLEIAAGNLIWREGGDTSFRGQVTVAGGPLLSLDAAKSPQAVALKSLTIDDDKRRARIALQLAERDIDLSFNGELTQETIDKIFASIPLRESSLRGDIQISASLTSPVRISARGQLTGTNLWLPLRPETARLEKFSIEASGDTLLIRTADLRWPKSHLTASGKIAGARERMRVDLDVAGNRLDWDELQRVFSARGKAPHEKKAGIVSIPELEGTIRLKTDRFTFKGVDVSPLEITAVLSPSEVRADIRHGAACGITIGGRVEFVGSEIGVDVQLTASDAQLEPVTLCLTNLQNDIKGFYSLRARVAGRGEQDRLLRSLKGKFDFSARNGEFVRSPGMDATFDYLNATGDFKVAFPDLDRETFPYRFVRVTGRIDGEMLLADEVNVDSSLLNLSGQAKIDLERKQIDGKGLIAVLRPVDEVISRIPVISNLLGESLVGIPVRVTGALERPDITYLSPADVGAELLNIPLRFLKLPFGAVKIFSPSAGQEEKVINK